MSLFAKPPIDTIMDLRQAGSNLMTAGITVLIVSILAKRIPPQTTAGSVGALLVLLSCLVWLSIEWLHAIRVARNDLRPGLAELRSRIKR